MPESSLMKNINSGEWRTPKTVRFRLSFNSNQRIFSLKVKRPPYKWNTAERYRQDLPNIDSELVWSFQRAPEEGKNSVRF